MTLRDFFVQYNNNPDSLKQPSLKLTQSVEESGEHVMVPEQTTSGDDKYQNEKVWFNRIKEQEEN